MFTIKIMSGPLIGLDLAFTAEKVLFLVGDAAALAAENGLQEGIENTEERHVAIPLDTASPKFILHFADCDDKAKTVMAEIFGEEGIYQETLAFNSLIHIGQLQLAIKREADNWTLPVMQSITRGEAHLTSSGITNDSKENNFASKTHDESNLMSHEKNGLSHFKDEQNVNGVAPRKFYRKSFFIKITLVVVCGLLLVVLINLLKPNLFKWGNAAHTKNASQKVETLISLLEPLVESHAISVLNGRNQTQYVVAKRTADFQFAQNIIRNKYKGYARQIKLVHLEAEQERVKKWLDAQGIVYFFVRAQAADHWHIAISQERNTAAFNATHLQQQILELLPYSKQISIQTRSDDEAISAARQVATNAGLDAHIIRTTQGVTVTIAGNIDDKQLIILRNALEQFKQVWGQGYVQFIVQLNDRPRLSSFIL